MERNTVYVILDEILDCEVTLQDFMSNQQRKVGPRATTRENLVVRKLPMAVYNKRTINA